MSLLNAKLQFNTFETGEFTEEKERTFEEVVALIRNFPWEDQTEILRVGLTNPSVTLDRNRKSFLKLLPYFHGKYALFYFHDGMLFRKIIAGIEDSFTVIADFFQNPTPDLNSFQEQRLTFQSVQADFFTNDFKYYVDYKTPMKYFGWETWLGVLLTLIVSLFFFPADFSFSDLEFYLLLLLFVQFFFTVAGINILLIMNHFSYSHGKVLQISKGAEHFLFGSVDNPRRFSKKNIRQIIIRKNDHRRVFWNEIELIFIIMDDGSEVVITSLHLSSEKLIEKCPGVPFSINRVFAPFYKW